MKIHYQVSILVLLVFTTLAQENLNNRYEKLTPDNCALLMVDHQTGLSAGVSDMNQV